MLGGFNQYVFEKCTCGNSKSKDVRKQKLGKFWPTTDKKTEI